MDDPSVGESVSVCCPETERQSETGPGTSSFKKVTLVVCEVVTGVEAGVTVGMLLPEEERWSVPAGFRMFASMTV
jgi:hypothetical protein